MAGLLWLVVLVGCVFWSVQIVGGILAGAAEACQAVLGGRAVDKLIKEQDITTRGG